MTAASSAPGCRDVAFATLLLVVGGVVMFTTGFALIRGEGCAGLCEVLGLTLIYAGGPVSALFGVLFGGLVVAWPLDVTLWVGAGFLAARIADRRQAGASLIAVGFLAGALVYGLVLSRFVEIAI